MNAPFPRFEFATAARVVFGAGALQEIGTCARQCGRRALVVTGGNPRRAETLLALLRKSAVAVDTLSISGEPTVTRVKEGTEQARDFGAEFIIAFGGGSALDAGKAIAALLTNGGEPLDYLEVIGRNRPLLEPPAPCLAIPTTAGTGAEVTRNAVLTSPEHRVKVSLRDPRILPWLALVDPTLTLDLPPAVTASTGLDALTQLIEPFVSVRANPLTDAVCREGLGHVARSLRRAVRDGRDLEARAGMALGSCLSGMALANAGLGAVHGFASPIGGGFDAPHGAVCAALLPHVMAANLRALRERAPDSPALARYGEVARIVTGDANATADAGVTWIAELVEELKIPKLNSHGIGLDNVAELVAKATAASSMKGNPIALTSAELTGILTAAL